MIQRATGARPAPRKRGRPRKIRTEEEIAAQAAKKRRTRVPNNDRRRIIKKYEAGRTVSQIAEDLDLHVNSVRTIVKRWQNTGLIDLVAKHERKARSTKYTNEHKAVVAALWVLDCTLSLDRGAKIASLLYPGVGFSSSSVNGFLAEARFTLKQLVARKPACNTARTLVWRQGYPDFIQQMLRHFRVVYYGAQNYNVSTYVKQGRAVGHQPALATPSRTGGGGAVSLHLAVTQGIGCVHAMVVGKDADEATTRQFLEGLVAALGRLPPADGDQRPWLLVLDKDKHHQARHVTEYLEDANLSYAFLPPGSPFLNPIEDVFSNIEMWLDRRPGFKYSAFTRNRTEAQLTAVCRDVLLAVAEALAPMDIAQWERRCALFHRACREGMPIYGCSRPPASSEVEDWVRLRDTYLEEFKNEPPDSGAMASAYSSRMGIPIRTSTDDYLAKAADGLEMFESMLAEEAKRSDLSGEADVRPGTEAWCTRAPMDVLLAYCRRNKCPPTAMPMVVYIARLQGETAAVQEQLDDTRALLSKVRRHGNDLWKQAVVASSLTDNSLRQLRRSNTVLVSAVARSSPHEPITDAWWQHRADALKEAQAMVASAMDAITQHARDGAGPGAGSDSGSGWGSGCGSGSGSGSGSGGCSARSATVAGSSTLAPTTNPYTQLQRVEILRRAGASVQEVAMYKTHAACLGVDIDNRTAEDMHLNLEAPTHDCYEDRIEEAMEAARRAGTADPRHGRKGTDYYRGCSVSFDRLGHDTLSSTELHAYMDARAVGAVRPTTGQHPSV